MTNGERAVGLLVSSAGAQAAGQRSSPRTLAVHSQSFFYKKCQQVLVPGLVSVFVRPTICESSKHLSYRVTTWFTVIVCQ
jgi:hypothetical protein